MGENSNIEWTDHTFNPWEGCTKVSPGCLRCYAETRNKRWNGGLNWGKGAPRRRTSEANWRQPLKWNREAEGMARKPRVFSASLADWLDAEVDPTWRHDFVELIRTTPNLVWLLLTKRPENFARLMENVWLHAASIQTRTFAWEWMTGIPPANVRVGASVEDQWRVEARCDALCQIPAWGRFLSCEPLLGELKLKFIYPIRDPKSPNPFTGIDWVIVGGESGAGARRMDEKWALSIKRQCRDANVAFFMKQLGGASDKRGAMEDLPLDLRVREFPA